MIFSLQLEEMLCRCWRNFWVISAHMDCILERVIADTKDVGKVEQEPRAEGRTLQMLLTPVAKKSGAQDAPAQED